MVTDTVEELRRRAPQTIELRFATPVAPAVFESLDGVQSVTVDGDRVTLQTTGRLAELLRVIADHDPLDVVARHADLDELFLSYYREDRAPMTAEIARYDLHNRRRSTIWYAVGMALYMLVIVVLYPSFKHSTELEQARPRETPRSPRCSARPARSPPRPAG